MSFQLSDVCVTHTNGFKALQHINLRVNSGEHIALIGPSGAGKTTLLQCIGTAVAPTSGSVQVLHTQVATPHPDGSLTRLPPTALRALRSQIGTVHQSPPIPLRQRVVTAVAAGKLGSWPWWKSVANLLYPQDIDGVRAALARVQLEEKMFVRCAQLSGGQLQRVGIARVLYQQAQLILADEPVSALDPALSLATVQLLTQEAKAHQTTLVASLHAVDLALQCFPRVLGIQQGRIAFDLPAEQVSAQHLRDLYGHDAMAHQHASLPTAAASEPKGLGTLPPSCHPVR